MIPTSSDALLWISRFPELSLLGKATIIVAIGLAAAGLAARARASVRHLLLAATFASVVALPLVARFAPEIAIPLVSVAAPPDVTPAPTARVSRVAPSLAAGAAAASGVSSGWPAVSSIQVARAAWTIGTIAFLVSLAFALWRVRHLRRTGLPWRETDDAVRSLAADAGLNRPVDVLLHEDVASPLTFGTRHPVIVLPTDARAWGDADLRRAIVHELEHVTRGDWVVQLAARAVCAAYWFHPLVWVAFRRLNLEAERACDDAVVAKEESMEYAEQLVSLAARLSAVHAQPTLGMANRSDLSVRVTSLLDAEQRRGRAGLGVAVSAVGAAALMVVTVAPVRAVATRVEMTSVVTAALPSPAQAPPPASAQGRRQRGLDVVTVAPVRAVATRVEMTPAVTAASPSPAQAPPPARPQASWQRGLDRELYEAAESGDIDGVNKTLAAGANVNAAIHGDGSALIAAARKGHIEMARLLLGRGANPDLGVRGDGTPLIAAAGRGDIEMARLLLDSGANPNTGLEGDGSPLIAASGGGQLAMMEFLLARGAELELVVRGDENPLIKACETGKLASVKWLVQRGADVNARVLVNETYGGAFVEWRTPLVMARRNGHADIVAFLISAGARE
jgi:beta-lactamase regulating signal transducer with metallopeptidase domain/ankyrin repeat protein